MLRFSAQEAVFATANSASMGFESSRAGRFLEPTMLRMSNAKTPEAPRLSRQTAAHPHSLQMADDRLPCTKGRYRAMAHRNHRQKAHSATPRAAVWRNPGRLGFGVKATSKGLLVLCQVCQ